MNQFQGASSLANVSASFHLVKLCSKLLICLYFYRLLTGYKTCIPGSTCTWSYEWHFEWCVVFFVFSISFESQISTGSCLSWSLDFAIHTWLVYAWYSDQWPAYLNNALDQWRAFFMVQLVPSLFLPQFRWFLHLLVIY